MKVPEGTGWEEAPVTIIGEVPGPKRRLLPRSVLVRSCVEAALGTIVVTVETEDSPSMIEPLIEPAPAPILTDPDMVEASHWDPLDDREIKESENSTPDDIGADLSAGKGAEPRETDFLRAVGLITLPNLGKLVVTVSDLAAPVGTEMLDGESCPVAG